ncbi:MAG: hypothetical protein JO317_01370 [Verrucomicrobiae bacterium]|nr:hypothetical protein [Verrucomicrobiae bacterium]
MPYHLDRAVIEEARKLFGPDSVAAVLRKLSESPLPLEQSGPPPRVHIAVLWNSKGDWKTFEYELEGAQHDWRDTLVSAGLAGEDWREVLKRRGVDASGW